MNKSLRKYYSLGVGVNDPQEALSSGEDEKACLDAVVFPGRPLECEESFPEGIKELTCYLSG